MESASQPQTTPPLLHNRYRITAKLGMSRLAVVYRATDERLQRSVLVHILRPEHQAQPQLLQRFVDEAQSRARRHHPALLEVYDSGDINGRPYIITEELRGQALKDALPIKTADALRILRQVVGAVQACREEGSAVPPVSSAGVVLCENGRPVLVEPWWLSSEQLALEQACYRAPERTQGAPPGPATLVYNLGILGYELLSGRRPYDGDVPQAVAQLHLQRDLPPALGLIPGFAPRLAQVLMRATQRRPEDRIEDLPSLARELAAVEAATDAPTQQLATPPRPLRQAVRESLRPITGSLRRQPQHAPPPPPPPMQQVAYPRQGPAPMPAYPQPQPIDLQQEVRRQVKREVRRSGCRRFLARRLVGLVFLLGLVGGCAWVVTFGLNWFTDGGARTACESNSLPGGICELLPGSENTLMAREDLNLRDAPSASSNIIGILRAGTRVERRGDPQVVDNISWLPVSAEIDGQQIDGWTAFDFLKEER